MAWRDNFNCPRYVSKQTLRLGQTGATFHHTVFFIYFFKLINPKQIRLVHQIFAPTEKEVAQAEAMVSAFREAAAAGIGVFTVNGKMVDVAFIPGAERTLKLAKACGMYEGDLV